MKQMSKRLLNFPSLSSTTISKKSGVVKYLTRISIRNSHYFFGFLLVLSILCCSLHLLRQSSNTSCDKITPPIARKRQYQYPLTIDERVKYYLTPKWNNFFTTFHKIVDIQSDSTLHSTSVFFNINSSLFSTGIQSSLFAHLNDSAGTNPDLKKLKFDKMILVSEEYLNYNDKYFACNGYCADVLQLLLKIKNRNITNVENDKENNTCQYAIQFGDRPLQIDTLSAAEIPVFKKTRFIDQENVLLLKLNTIRHWNFWSKVEKHDIPFEEKRSNILWRGTMTGYQYWRYSLVQKYYKYGENTTEHRILRNHYFGKSLMVGDQNGSIIDIAFHKRGQNYAEWKEKGLMTDHLIRDQVSIPNMLHSKYLVSVPGNDVATNLNWILFSNSVPFLFQDYRKKDKEKESWTMHGLLQPFVHYIPFNLSDDSLINAYEFCELNEENCSRIAQNGKQWMIQFRDTERENNIQLKMLALYCKNTHVV